MKNHLKSAWARVSPYICGRDEILGRKFERLDKHITHYTRDQGQLTGHYVPYVRHMTSIASPVKNDLYKIRNYTQTVLPAEYHGNWAYAARWQPNERVISADHVGRDGRTLFTRDEAIVEIIALDDYYAACGFSLSARQPAGHLLAVNLAAQPLISIMAPAAP